MRLSHLRRGLLARAGAGALAIIATIQPVLGASHAVPAAMGARDNDTTTPIKHVIVIVGENRSYDHLFATFVPKKKNQTTVNLLSEGIVNADGTAGPNAELARQHHAKNTEAYSISPTIVAPYKKMPAPTTGYVHQSASDTNPPPFATTAVA